MMRFPGSGPSFGGGCGYTQPPAFQGSSFNTSFTVNNFGQGIAPGGCLPPPPCNPCGSPFGGGFGNFGGQFGGGFGAGFGMDPLSTLIGGGGANLGPLGFQSAVNQFTLPMTANPIGGMNGLLGPMAGGAGLSSMFGGGMMGGMNGLMGGGMMGGMGNSMMGGMGNSMMGLMGGGAGGMSNMLNPFTLASMPFGNPYLQPQMLQYQDMMQQQQMAQMGNFQQPPQEQKPDILKIVGIGAGLLLLMNLMKSGDANGGGLASLFGNLFGGGNNS